MTDPAAANPGHFTPRMLPRAFYDDDGQLLFVHDCLAECGDGKTRMMAARMYTLDIPRWAVTSAPDEPLSIIPSIDCGACDTHGFIKNGAWIDA